MAHWYTLTTPAPEPEEISRLEQAWPGAPVDMLAGDSFEVTSMLLEVARQQVVAYAPAVTESIFEPLELDWSGGLNNGTLSLSRVGDVVTAAVTLENGNPGFSEIVLTGIPAYLLPAGKSDGANYFIESDAIWIDFDGPSDLVVIRWLADAAEGNGVPQNLVYAQLMQAQNLYNAGRAQQDGAIGSEGYSFVPRPLDKTVRSIIRPTSGVANVF